MMTRAELSQAMNLILEGQQLPAIFQDLPPEKQPTIPIEPALVPVLTALVLGWPVHSAYVTAQRERFAIVEYSPIFKSDPDILLTLASGTAAENFHRCMLVFQKERRRPARMDQDPGAWLELHAKPAIRLVAAALWHLKPSLVEIEFCLRWLLTTACQYRVLYD